MILCFKLFRFTQKGKHGHWNFGLELPLLDIQSKYNLKGQILVLPLVGHGNCELKLYNIRTKIFTNITFPTKEGREIMHIDNMKVKFRVGALRVKFDNLFNGNKILGKFTFLYTRLGLSHCNNHSAVTIPFLQGGEGQK